MVALGIAPSPGCSPGMRWPRSKRLLVLHASSPDPLRLRTVARWARALVPAAVLVITSVDTVTAEIFEDAIVLDVDEVASSPLALAEAIARAAGAGAATRLQ